MYRSESDHPLKTTCRLKTATYKLYLSRRTINRFIVNGKLPNKWTNENDTVELARQSTMKKKASYRQIPK